MKRNEDEAVTAAQLRQLRDGWQPAGELPADYAAQVVAVSMRRRRVRRISLSVLLALVAVVPVASAPMVATGEVLEGPEVVSPVIAAVAPQPPEEAAQEPARSQEPDLVAEAVVLRPERVLTSRRSYRDSFRELGEEYDGIADIYFDDTAR